MKIKIKKLNDFAVLPEYKTDGAAGMDLTAISRTFDGNGNVVFGTGLAFEIPDGYVGLVFPRSSIAENDMFLTNSVGVIDSDYRGEVMMKFKSCLRVLSNADAVVKVLSKQQLRDDDDIDVTNIWHNNLPKVGDRIGQLIIVPYPRVEWEQVAELSETKRGNGGYGSTGK